MTRPYECETRILIKDINGFEKRLRELRAKLLYRYEFTDHYFIPAGGGWDSTEKNLRIREWKKPARGTQILFEMNRVNVIDGIGFKRSLYPEGKMELFKGSLQMCRRILEDLGFIPWIKIRKEKAKVVDIPAHNFDLAVEFIKGVGWTAELEFEGSDARKARKKIHEALKVLDVSEFTHKSISAICHERQTNGL